jgi:hypothetical protein
MGESLNHPGGRRMSKANYTVSEIEDIRRAVVALAEITDAPDFVGLGRAVIEARTNTYMSQGITAADIDRHRDILVVSLASGRNALATAIARSSAQ